jgi:hypothetical protein
MVPEGGGVFYDLRYCTIGDVQLDLIRGTLGEYLFMCTKFSNFDFIQIEDQLEKNGFDIHTFDYPEDSLDESPIYETEDRLVNGPYSSSTQLQHQAETYTRAKNGAKALGADSIASGFFVKQKKAEHAKFEQQLGDTEDGGMVKSLRRKLWKNKLLRYSCKYGESPWYPLGWSGFVLSVSGSLYSLLGISTPDGVQKILPCLSECGPVTDVGVIWLKGLYLSAVTFTSLGSGAYSPGSSLARFVAGTEALAGAFLIALFVFTLGRQVSR